MPRSKSKQNKRRKSNKKTMKGAMKGAMKGGFAGVSARYYYPQNMLAQDPQRDIQTSQIMKGGCGCGMKGGSKNHTRKYLKGGAGFFNNFGTTTGASTAAAQLMGVTKYPAELKPSYLV